MRDTRRPLRTRQASAQWSTVEKAHGSAHQLPQHACSYCTEYWLRIASSCMGHHDAYAADRCVDTGVRVLHGHCCRTDRGRVDDALDGETCTLRAHRRQGPTRSEPMADVLQVNGTELVDSGGRAVRLRGVGLGGWMNMENFITGYSGTEEMQREGLRAVLGEELQEFFFDRF